MAVFPTGAINTRPAAGAISIDQSLRFNDNDTAYLSRTPSSAGNRKTWTWSAWVKRGNIGISNSVLFGAGNTSNPDAWTFGWVGQYVDQFVIMKDGTYTLITTAKYRDPSAWYHIVVKSDTTQSTATDRLKLYINGEEVTDFATDARSTVISQDEEWFINNTTLHALGKDSYYATSHDGYMAEVHHIDGQALDASYFGETDETYGHWTPISYTGSHGTNGFYLDFSGTYYNDQSGNGNNWTANNLASTDVVLDSPTNNFCTANDAAAHSSANLTQGGLAHSGSNYFALGTIAVSSGKWYWEHRVGSDNGGIINVQHLVEDNGVYTDWLYNGGNNQDAYGYYDSGQLAHNNSFPSYGSSFGTGDILGIALNLDDGNIVFYKNGTSQGTGYTGLPSTGLWTPKIGHWNTDGTGYYNFGQDSSFAGTETAQGNQDDNGIGDFYYSPPSGFLALCTSNLPDPDVVPSENFNIVTWAGDNSTSRGITGVGFQPDFTWLKGRAAFRAHELVNVVVGGDSNLLYNLGTYTTQAEDVDLAGNSNGSSAYGAIKQFDSDGFTVRDGNSGRTNVNASGENYIAWNWKTDNTSGSSNTNGSITSTVSANQDAGFSIISYTGTGSNATVGHGLSQTPELIIVTNRDTNVSTGGKWNVWTPENDGDNRGLLESTAAFDTSTGVWNYTNPTSSVFSIGSNATYYKGVNQSGAKHIAYAFHSVEGYSKIGYYTGNQSTDGTFTYTGFKPAWVMVRRTDYTRPWCIYDNARSPYNLVDDLIQANSSTSEDTGNTASSMDFLSNGFKQRNSDINTNTGLIMYVAFAENPFKYTNAR